mgnify:CR=1 FL=1
MNGDQYVTQSRKDGSFTLYNIPSGEVVGHLFNNNLLA